MDVDHLREATRRFGDIDWRIGESIRELRRRRDDPPSLAGRGATWGLHDHDRLFDHALAELQLARDHVNRP